MKVKFSELKPGDIFLFNGHRMKKNKDTTAIFVDTSGKHQGWTHMGINDMCEVVVKETK
jgi:hypothetical protein